MADLTTRQGLSRLLTVTDHKRDFSGDRLEAQVVSAFGEAHTVGSTLGEPVGTDILINLSFDDIPEGSYNLRVCGPDEIVFPADDRTFTIKVKDGC